MVAGTSSFSLNRRRTSAWTWRPVALAIVAGSLLLVAFMAANEGEANDHVTGTRGLIIHGTKNLSRSMEEFAASLPTSTYSQKASTSLAAQHSNGFFDDIGDEHWRLQQQRAQRHQNHIQGKNPLRGWPGIQPALWYQNNYDPLFTCPHMVRVGGPGDGPKWTCDPHRLQRIAQQRKCIIYSVGCAGKYEWEDGLVDTIGPVCEIHVFDPTKDFTRPGDADNKNIHFHPWGLHSSYDASMKPWEKGHQTYYTLQEAMVKLGHEGQTIDIFKIDCEFCEWFTFRDWISDQVDIRQLLIETHNLPGPVGAKVFFPFETQLKPTDFFDGIQQAGFAMFSKEPNIHPVAKGDGVEWGYVKLHPDFWSQSTSTS